jgi:flagellar biosynthetic protein FlhB
MAEEYREHEERTEEATPQRREQARERGQVARSRDLCAALTLISGVIALAICGPSVATALMRIGHAAFENLHVPPLSRAALAGATSGLFWYVLPFFLGTTLVAALSSLAQTGVPHAAWLAPDLSRLNPLPRLAQLFRPGLSGWELLKTALKIGGVGLLGWGVLLPVWEELSLRPVLPPAALLERSLTLSQRLLTRLGLLLLGLAVIDYLVARWRLERELRMSHHEVREELRHSEGNPQVKRRLRKKAREILRRRLQVDVPRADVVVVNPTHVAVALSYRQKTMRAPRVVAKGVDHLALRIRELARGAGVPVVHNPPLARDLNRRVKVGAEVPADLYRAVAEVLAFVYRIRPRGLGSPA